MSLDDIDTDAIYSPIQKFYTKSGKVYRKEKIRASFFT